MERRFKVGDVVVFKCHEHWPEYEGKLFKITGLHGNLTQYNVDGIGFRVDPMFAPNDRSLELSKEMMFNKLLDLYYGDA